MSPTTCRWVGEWQRHYDTHVYAVDIIHGADMDESHGTQFDNAYIDNHDYDDDTDEDTDDDNDHKNDSYTAAGAAPGASVPCSLFLRSGSFFDRLERQISTC